MNSSKSSTVLTVACACVVSVTLACAVQTPLAPEAPAASASANADGSTLKANAPTLVSPINNQVLSDARPTMVVAAATGQFASGAFQYQFQLLSDAGAVVSSTTQAGTSWGYPSELSYDTAYRWQARATLNGAVGPWSSTGRFLTGKAPLPRVTNSSSEGEFHAWFDALRVLRNVGPTLNPTALRTLEPDLVSVNIILQKSSNGDPRGRIYLPTLNGDLYSRAVDLGDFGGPWQWLYRGASVCEGICK